MLRLPPAPREGETAHLGRLDRQAGDEGGGAAHLGDLTARRKALPPCCNKAHPLARREMRGEGPPTWAT